MTGDRREFIRGGVALGAFAATVGSAEDGAGIGKKRETVVYVSCHPDDLGGSVGTVIRLAQVYDVHVVEFTHGERGLGESGYRDGTTARLRTAEDEAVCRAIGVPLHWCDEIDGEAFAGREACERLAGLFRQLRPRAIITHWLLETHCDHLMSAAAAIKAIDLADLKPEIYFQEQEIQSRGFVPAYYVDVSDLTERKRKIIELWACQHGAQMAERKIRTSVVNGWRIGGMENAEVFGVFPGTVTPGRSIFDALTGVRQA